MRKFLSVILVFTMILSIVAIPMSVGAVAAEFSYRYVTEDDFYYLVFDDTAELIEYYGSATKIYIPSEVEGCRVTSIADYAFESCTSLTSVNIPDSVTSIGDYAFKSCTGLTSVNIPGSVTSIGDYAFKSCTGLTSVNIPGSVTSIGDYAFASCTGLASVNIPDSITSIGIGAFYECSKLESIVIPDSVTSIADWTFSFCSSLASVVIPDGVTSIGEWAFQSCNSLTKVKLPQKLTTISKGAFNNSDGITEFIVPDSVTYIGDSAFFCCDSLTKVVLPAGLQYLGRCAMEFYYDPVYFKGTSKQWENVQVEDRTRTDGMYGSWMAEVVCMGDAPSVKVQNAADGIKIKWSKISDVTRENRVYNAEGGFYTVLGVIEGADNYVVYRRSFDNNKWSKWDAIKKTPDHSYVDKKAKSGVVYQYTVKAIYEDLNSATKNSDSIRRLATPIVKVNNVKNGVTVKWGKVTKATEYEVYKRKKGSEKWNKLATTKKTAYTDKSVKTGTTYYYTVKAMSDDAVGAYNTKGVNVKYVATPKLKKIQNATGGLKITWSKVSGADGYYVYRKVYGAKSWTKVATVKGGKNTSYKDTKVSKGKVYVYSVKSYDGSAKSAMDSIGIKLRYLAVPTLKSVISTKKGIKFTWGKVTGAEGYYVYRKTGSGDWKKIGTIKRGSTVTYLDRTAKKGKTYKYTVKAFKGETNSYYNTKGLKIKDKY